MNKILILSCFLFLCVQTCFAQYITDFKRLGDAAFKQSDYYAAADYYYKALNGSGNKKAEILPYSTEKHLQNKKLNAENLSLSLKLADSYRLYNDFTDAEKWYEKAISLKGQKPFSTQYWYATCLRANKKYAESIVAFTTFLNSSQLNYEWNENAKAELANSQFALVALKHPVNVDATKIQVDVNGAGSNYAATMLGDDKILFTSSRKVMQADLPAHKINLKGDQGSQFRSRLYEASGIRDSFLDVQPYNFPADAGHQQGAITLSPDKQTMILNKWLVKGTGSTEAVLYISHKANDIWSVPVPLGPNVNMKGYNAIQPGISTDGKYLFFSSNRPGGSGGYDIWYSKLDASFIPGLAVNPGAVINTPGDEKAPFYNSRKKQLTFSTNGRVGMGGMDLFRSEGEPGFWVEPANLSYPVNSAKEDVYYSETDSSGDSFYISSDRESPCCLEIYYMERQYSYISGTVLNFADQKPLKNAIVKLINDSTRAILYDVRTGDDGQFSFRTDPGIPCSVVLSKANYFTKKIGYPVDSMKKGAKLYSVNSLHDIPPTPIVLKNIEYDFDMASLRPASAVMLDSLTNILKDNPRINIILGSHTDSKGTDKYNLTLSSRRAVSCIKYLVDKGINIDRLTGIGHGRTMPIAPNTLKGGKDNPAGRQMNRRTDFQVIKNI